MSEVDRKRCPFCNPKPRTDEGKEEKEITLVSEPNGPKPGQCHGCRGSNFNLKYVNRVMVRECNDCGVWYDLEKSKPWEA